MKTKVNGQWRDFSDGWAKVNGVWRQITDAFTKVGGLWKPVYQLSSIVPLYTEGVENVLWVPGYAQDAGVQSKESNHLYIEGAVANLFNTQGERAYVTDALIDLTHINTLYIDWEKTATPYEIYANTYGTFVVSTNKMGDRETRTAWFTDRGVWSRRINTINVSSLSGHYYIRVHARTGASLEDYPSKVKVYKVWGER
ncbi:hypothetical protein [Desulforamulus aquiferis]|uniref:Uncharacterized protein n=1 Tax=Desulforamulus aquiferis TaxID=1397668 RepID=A0AAW7ZBQ3_9FIRM|nr:hypothetical protein [Desulforamulus aquiferis]MDO7787112.1 hypothetical protein [Desulforamulus aquiferis]